MNNIKTLSIIFAAILALGFAPNVVFAHQSGCHRWHSCPSDSGSYTCGDTGYCSQCPDNNYCKAGQPISQYEFEPTKPVEKSITVTPTQEPQKTIPDWVRNIFIWYANDKISESDLLTAIEFLIKQGIIKI